MNVAQWLNAIGLGQYEANFRDNKIDFDVLADLSRWRPPRTRRASRRP